MDGGTREVMKLDIYFLFSIHPSIHPVSDIANWETDNNKTYRIAFRLTIGRNLVESSRWWTNNTIIYRFCTFLSLLPTSQEWRASLALPTNPFVIIFSKYRTERCQARGKSFVPGHLIGWVEILLQNEHAGAVLGRCAFVDWHLNLELSTSG